MSRALRTELIWLGIFVAALVSLRAFFFSQQTEVFEAALPAEKVALTPVFSLARDTVLRVRVERLGGKTAQPLEIELVDSEGRLLAHQPFFVEKNADATDTQLFEVEAGEASVTILRDVTTLDPLRMTITTGAQSNSQFGLAFAALLAPPLFRLARSRRTSKRQGST